MADLVQLKNIERLSPLVTRVLGQNPGPYTLQGTNTYIIGTSRSPSLVLLDAGQDIPSYIPLLRSALAGYSGHVKDIILSHHHHDHILGLRSVLPCLKELGGPAPHIHKFLCRNNPNDDEQTKSILAELKGLYQPGKDNEPISHLQDGQKIDVADGQATLKVISTPGHTEDSASFLLSLQDSKIDSESVLFTADTVLGQGTAVFTDLKALISSLERLIQEVQDPNTASPVKLYCGHGPIVEDGAAKMREYIDHRMQREQQVLDALRQANRPLTVAEYVISRL